MIEEPMELSDRHPGSPIVVAGSVRGTGHDEKGASCEDAFAFESFETPQHAGVAFAVADGAGSASHAAIGAEVSTRKVVERIVKEATCQQDRIENGTWKEILKIALFYARTSLIFRSWKLKVDTSALAATMLAGAFLEDGRLAYAQVGDGAIVARRAEPARPEDLGEQPLEEQPLEEQSNEAAAAGGTPAEETLAEETLAEETDAPGRENDSLTLVTEPQGKYANEMIPLSSSESREHWQIGVSEGQVEGVAAFTDGLSHMCLDLGAGVPRDSFLGELFRTNARLVAEDGIAKANAGLQAYLGSGEVQSRTRDDVTLLLALRPSGLRSSGAKDLETSEAEEPELSNSAEPDAPPEPDASPEPDVGDGAGLGSEAEKTPSGKTSSEEFSSEKSSSEKSASWTDEILPLSVERVTETVRKAFYMIED